MFKISPSVKKQEYETVEVFVPFNSEYTFGYNYNKHLGVFSSFEEARQNYPNCTGVETHQLVQIGDGLYVKPDSIIKHGKESKVK